MRKTRSFFHGEMFLTARHRAGTYLFWILWNKTNGRAFFLTFSRISVASAVNRRILLAGGRHRLTNVSRFLFFDSFLSSSIPFWLTSIGIDFIRSFLFVFFVLISRQTHTCRHTERKKKGGGFFSVRGGEANELWHWTHKVARVYSIFDWRAQEGERIHKFYVKRECWCIVFKVVIFFVC